MGNVLGGNEDLLINNNDLNAKELLHIVDNSPKGEKLVFFVGSGISMMYPSLLPSASSIVTKTVKALRPKPFIKDCKHGLNIDTKIISNILPEIYYEIITDVLGDQILRIWELLEFWRFSKKISKYNLGPNSYHFIIVYLSWINKKPIITTNFDNLFEEAALRLGLHGKYMDQFIGHHMNRLALQYLKLLKLIG